jgi:Co/Zn/Cd efflux system component
MTSADSSTLKPDHRSKRKFFRTKTFRLLSMLSLTFGFFLVELIVGNITNSVALVADAFHMLSDVISLVIAIAAVRISKRRSDINTYGWVRAEVVGANINTVFLLALCLTIVFDAIKRFIQPELIQKVDLLLIVGSIGLGINIIGLFLFQGFHGHSHGGGSHGHSHGGGSHEHSSEKKSHQHSHDNDSHGHSHGDDSHGHSHGEDSHGHSHGDDSHGHSHNHTDAIPKDSLEMDEIGVDEDANKFERHSTRALQEVRLERKDFLVILNLNLGYR